MFNVSHRASRSEHKKKEKEEEEKKEKKKREKKNPEGIDSRELIIREVAINPLRLSH